MPSLPLTTVFDDLPDPRRETRNKLHRLTDILVIATRAVIAGAQSWEAIAEYGRAKQDLFRGYLALSNGIPSPDTFERVLAKLDPVAFARAFGRGCEADFQGFRYDGHAELEEGHGRHEERYVMVIYDPPGLPPDWPDVAAVVMVNREREVGGERTCTSHYYLMTGVLQGRGK